MLDHQALGALGLHKLGAGTGLPAPDRVTQIKYKHSSNIPRSQFEYTSESAWTDFGTEGKVGVLRGKLGAPIPELRRGWLLTYGRILRRMATGIQATGAVPHSPSPESAGA